MIRHGRNVAVYVGGADCSGDLNSVNPVSEQDLLDVTTFGQAGYTNYPGLSKDSGTIEGLFNSTARTVFESMIQVTTTKGMMIPFGQSLGDQAYATNAVILKSNSVRSVVTDVNRMSVSFQTQNYPFESCRMLSSGKQSVGVASTGQGTSWDNGSDSGTTGGAAYAQVFSVTGGTLTLSVQQSSTGAFAGEQTTTATFSAASSAETQRVAITSSILRYARAAWVGATSTSQFALALVRY